MPQLNDQITDEQSEFDRLASAARYSNVEEAVTFLAQSQATTRLSDRHAVCFDLSSLDGNQNLAYDIVRVHNDVTDAGTDSDSLKLIVSGTAGTGSRSLLGHGCRILSLPPVLPLLASTVKLFTLCCACRFTLESIPNFEDMH